MAEHLRLLADALNAAGDVTAVLNSAVSRPFIDVSAASFGVGERITCRRGPHGWEYAWGWGPAIGGTDDIDGAASAVRTAMRPLCGAAADGGE